MSAEAPGSPQATPPQPPPFPTQRSPEQLTVTFALGLGAMGGLISGAVIAFCLVIGFAFSGWGDWYYDAEPPIVEGLEVMESEARPGGFYLRVSNPSGQTVQSLLVKLNERAENGSLTRIFEDYVAEPLAPGAELETLITLRDPVTFQALDPAGRSLEIRLIQGYTAY